MDPQTVQAASETTNDTTSWVKYLLPFLASVFASYGTAQRTVNAKLAAVDRDAAVTANVMRAETEATRREMGEMREDMRELRGDIRDLSDRIKR